MKNKKNVRINSIIIILIVAFFLACIVKLSYISLAKTIDGVDLKAYAAQITTTKKTLYASRGSIYDVNGNYDTIYLDLINSREIKEIDALYKYFDNGYGYTLKDNVLKVYKNKDELEKFDNIKSYLGGYLFSTNDNSIIELEFHKEK